MITDTDRIDYLEEHREMVYQVVTEERVPRTDGTSRYDLRLKHLGWSLRHRTDECSSIRRAIDAGINNLEEPVFDEV